MTDNQPPKYQVCSDQVCSHKESLLYRVPLIYAASSVVSSNQGQLNTDRLDVIHHMQRFIKQYQLPIELSIMALEDEPVAKQLNQKKMSQKYCQQLSHFYKDKTHHTPIFILDNKVQLSLLIDGIRVSPEWSKLQRRIVRAGRKSELLLQAAKIADTHQVLDATAGFGHDSLILASTGSQVTMLEQQPLLLLLLLIEQQYMATQKNWQQLMARLHIKWAHAEDYLAQAGLEASKYNLIYFDPMFPDHSYDDAKTGKGAKVGKHMQALHGIVAPPSLQDETHLFRVAKQALTVNTDSSKSNHGNDNNNSDNKSRLLVKRPISAPPLANQTPDTSWRNDVVRFDGYFF